MTPVHPHAVVATARTLFASGLNQSEVARRLGLPLSTVRHWCVGERRAVASRPSCARCDDDLELDEAQYAYLLGSYLGDGHITIGARRVASLSVFCADDYPGVRREVEGALRAAMPSSSVSPKT